MVSMQTDDVRRVTQKLGKRARKVSRKAGAAMSDVADRGMEQARDAARATTRSMRKHPIAWTSAAVGAAALAGYMLLRRGA